MDFTIRIPISEKAVVEEKDELITAKQTKAHILVIEDEEEVRSLLSTILARGEHEIEIASDGREGIEICQII